MKITPLWFDVDPYLRAGLQPVHMFERPLLHGNSPKNPIFSSAETARVGEFWVPQGPLILPGVEFSVTRAGDLVRIPVIAYRTNERAIASIFAAGIEIGLAAVMQLRQYTRDDPTELIMALGHECHDLATEEAFRCYVGMALRTK